MSKFQKLQVRYQTAPVLPPPYAHFYTITLQPAEGSNELSVDFAVTYTDREDLDADEIMAEGFTPDDDLTWTGTLPMVWKEVIAGLLDATRLKALNEQALRDEDEYFELINQTPEGRSYSGEPTNREAWLYLSQELVQAIYETSGKERPFALTYLDRSRDEATELTINASFSQRDVQVQTSRKGKTHRSTLPWRELQPLMERVYGVQYLFDESLSQTPRHEGQFLNTGGEEWYELGKGVVNADDPNALNRLSRTLRQLAGS